MCGSMNPWGTKPRGRSDVRQKPEGRNRGRFRRQLWSRFTTGSIDGAIVDSSQADARGVAIGFIKLIGNEALVELPRETLRGHWRL